MKHSGHAILDAYCNHCLDGGGAFTYAELLRQVKMANKVGLRKTDIISQLNHLLVRLEKEHRDEEFEIVAELIQRILGFFSPSGVIHLDDDPAATD